MKKALITGIAGFAGSHLSEFLLSQEIEVFGFYLPGHSTENVDHIKEKINYAKDEYDAVRGKDAILLVTEWAQFAELDFGRIKKLVKKPIILDGRNFLDSEKVKRAGFIHFKIGA